VPRRLLLTLAAGAVLALPACGSDIITLAGGSGTFSAKELATRAEDALEREVGTRPRITCPEELAKEEGATTRCTLTDEDGTVEYGVTVTVTSDDGDTRIEVDDEPLD
jgi:hypothetical protein